MSNNCLYQSFGPNILFSSTYNSHNNNKNSENNNYCNSNTTIGLHNSPNIESICFDIKMYPANHSETPSQSGQSQFKSIPVTDHCDISHLQPYSWDMLDYSSQVVEPRRRELRAVPTVSEIDDNGVDSYFNVSMNQDHHIHRVHDGTTSSGGNGDNFNNSNNIIVKKRKITGHRRIGDRPYPKRMMSASDKCTLEVRKIPPQLNNMKNLLSHFQKFGNIVNLQVSPDNDPEAALVTFEHPSEAMNAYRSTEAVLNNRFIRVFWHNRDHQHQSYSNQSKQQSQHHHQPQHSLLSVVGNFGSGSQQKSDDYSASDVRRTRNSANNINNHHGERVPRVSVKDRLGSRVGKSVTRVSKYLQPENLSNVVGEAGGSEPTSSTMNDVSSPTKPQPVVASQSGSQPSTEDASENSVPNEPENDLNKEKLHKKLELQKKRQAILYKVVELQKKRQEILLSYMRQQKILVEKLGKAKNDKEKSEIKATVDTLAEQIKGLEDEIRKEAQTILTESAKLSTSDKKNKLQVEKELLDAELDFYNKLQKGETSAELSKKLHELKLKANYLGVTNSRSPRFLKRFANMRGALQNRKARANHVLGRNTFDKFRKVDRRTRKVLVEDIGEEDNMDLLSHISQYAEVETIDHSPQGSIVTFKTRQDAEVGMRQISSVKFREHQGLKCSWYEGDKSKQEGSENEATDSISKLNDENSLDEKIEKEEHEEENQEGNGEKPGTNLHDDDLLLGLNVNDLLDEEESEDEDESRAWRR